MTQPNLYANVESCTLCTVCNTLLYSVQCTLYNCSAVQYTVIFSKEAVGVITKLCTTRECYAVVYYISEFHFNHNTVENAHLMITKRKKQRKAPKNLIAH